MATATKYDTLAAEILQAVGGEHNVASVTHCATRLRFQLKDRDKADKAAVEATKGVITVVEAGGQFQVVIGNTVSNVYESIANSTSISTSAEGGAQGGFLGRAIDLITSIFTPFLWVLAGTGLLKALLAVAVKVWPDWAGSASYAILFSAADAVFQFLPILLAITSAKKFGANLYTSVAIAAALIYSATISVIPGPDGVTTTLSGYAASGGELSFFGIPVIMISYLSGVIPTILAVYAQSKLEKVLNRGVPETFRNFVVPMVTVAIIVPLTFIVIGPIADWVGTTMSDAINAVWNLSPAVGGAIMGAFWQVFVIFGIHWGFVPVMIQDLSSQGYSLLTGPLFPAVLAQSGAAAAVFLKTRNKELKEVAGPATISAFLAGITEPAIYGVTLRLKKPFIYACIGGAVGGAIAAGAGTAAMGFVLPGAITLSSAIDGPGNFIMLLVGTGLAIVIAFVLTMVLGFKDIPETRHVAGPEAVADEGVVPSEATAITSPVAGTVVPLAAVPDQVFASGAMGQGTGVLPTEGKVYSPIAGVITAQLPHAYGITADNGMEVLIHVGIDTVNLKGKHFSPKVAKGQRVEAGDLLVEFDLAAVIAAGYNPMTILVVTNSADYQAVVHVTEDDVRARELVLEVVG
ncbi:MAG TPA: beta-glucoside-specific PTS transporter subunit IIABC [Candidatus Nanopelagicales bacterium]